MELKEKLIKDDFVRFKHLFLTAFSDEQDGYIMISYLNEDMECLDSYIEQINNLYKDDRESFKKYMNILIPLYCENLCISKDTYDSFNDKGKEEFNNLYRFELLEENKSNNQLNMYNKKMDILKNYKKYTISYDLFR